MRLPQVLPHHLLRRILLAMLLSALLTSVVSAWIFYSANQRAAEMQRQNARNHCAAVIADLNQRWGREAFNLKVRLESMHFLENGMQQKDQLLAHLTAQGASLDFSALRIEDAKGELLVAYEYGGHKTPRVRFRPGQETAWAFDAAAPYLYMAFRQPIWLGKENGHLTLFRPLDHALLTQYNYPEIRLSLWWNERPIASSEGIDGVTAARAAYAKSGTPTSLDRLPWSGVDSDEAPILFIESISPPLLSASELALPVVITLIAFAFALWAMLGSHGLGTLRSLWRSESPDTPKP